jgi:hypothetical protein
MMALHQARQGEGDLQNLDAAKADPFAVDFGSPEQERSNLFTFLMGGVVIAAGLFAFLLMDRDVPAKAALTQSDGFIRVETHVPRDSVATHRSPPDVQTVTQ